MAKFKVGEEVAVKHGKDVNMTLVITQIIETICSVGTQTEYEGRVWHLMSQSPDNPAKTRYCQFKTVRFNEIELEKKGE